MSSCEAADKSYQGCCLHHYGCYKPLPVSDSVPSYYTSSPPCDVFIGGLPSSARCSACSSIIVEFTSHIQIMDDIPRRLLCGRKLCHVPERKGWLISANIRNFVHIFFLYRFDTGSWDQRAVKKYVFMWLLLRWN